MVAGPVIKVARGNGSLSYADVRRLESSILGSGRMTVLLDFAHVEDASTAALARLVVVRRKLLRSGCDLHILHLHGHARSVYEVARMDRLLPSE